MRIWHEFFCQIFPGLFKKIMAGNNTNWCAFYMIKNVSNILSHSYLFTYFHSYLLSYVFIYFYNPPYFKNGFSYNEVIVARNMECYEKFLGYEKNKLCKTQSLFKLTSFMRDSNIYFCFQCVNVMMCLCYHNTTFINGKASFLRVLL